MTHYITTKSGHCFLFKTSEQANKFLERIKSMTYNQVEKLHREIYGSTSTATTSGVKGRNGA